MGAVREDHRPDSSGTAKGSIKQDLQSEAKKGWQPPPKFEAYFSYLGHFLLGAERL